jgi:hypothetical protein
MYRIFLILIFVCCLCAVNIYAEDSPQDFSKGPLSGKSLYIPFLIHYNLPSLPAKSGEQFNLQYHFSLYKTQDARFKVDILPLYEGRRYDKEYIISDYEGFAAELGVAYNILNEVQAGVDMRLFYHSGGFMDSFLEKFHSLFHFSNGGREFFLQDQIYINIPNDKGDPMFLDRSAVSFGDIDLWCKWTFMEDSLLSLAAMGAFKLPTGKFKSLSGSGYPDAALGLLADFRISRFVSLYTQAGIVTPFTRKYYPMFNGLLGAEVHPWKFLSFNLQMNIKTSPISDRTIPFGWNSLLGTDFYQFNLPQTNVLAGVALLIKNFRLQFYFEEDTIFNQGNDFAIVLMVSHTIKLK